ncbi:MAG TPA: DNA-processing protein DprA [Fervidobacterium sp.]|nr:DNA-processing protein DprA [Fervidobacterium sp.]HPZ18100.1 DNA-processing protein DprA [Fervidobacterium sp.]HQE49366.1 DNA-processing protein DprA [Fervidobacterium sp.]HUM43153.1 DNA-processing protein DprA [Fervidobacterium sp.]
MDTTNAFLSDDSKAILLICSDIVVKYVKNVDLKPLTVAEWNKISKKLLDSAMKSPKAFFDTTVDDWMAHLDISQDEAERIENLLKQSAYLGFELERLANMGIWVTTRAEKTYPPALKSKLKYKSPVVLYCSGNPDLFEEEGIAIVGSRNVDEDGMNFAQVVARKCANEQLTVISGGAKGVDTIAQMAALSSGGTVISVLADSMEKVVRKRELRDAIIENKLLIVSPFNPESTFKIYNAMDRNKYIYALSKAAIVVSSDYGKGGTWSGATENLKNGWVPLYVRNGSNVPQGNLELIKKGAIPLDENMVYDEMRKLTDILVDGKSKDPEQIRLFDF